MDIDIDTISMLLCVYETCIAYDTALFLKYLSLVVVSDNKLLLLHMWCRYLLMGTAQLSCNFPKSVYVQDH